MQEDKQYKQFELKSFKQGGYVSHTIKNSFSGMISQPYHNLPNLLKKFKAQEIKLRFNDHNRQNYYSIYFFNSIEELERDYPELFL